MAGPDIPKTAIYLLQSSRTVNKSQISIILPMKLPTQKRSLLANSEFTQCFKKY